MDHICGFFYFYKNSVFITFYFTFHHQEKQRSICTGVPLSVPGETERKTGETDRQTDREEEPVLIRESSSLTPGPQRNEPGQKPVVTLKEMSTPPLINPECNPVRGKPPITGSSDDDDDVTVLTECFRIISRK
ncbi:T-cell acute lymphocytic leukemia protein 2 isoform X3 [Neoarius graeffei]|uniref:T-cell acute lymphocytic leukemia protein 2 isoform X3 n=1 Tax=Neoarius graeffei TaxID=443677 RepID=UPI00298C44F3|nr:T-cell acute lymphocytic leukemia protein 2 isoform X3 [Neoarius graeffei]